MGCIIEFFLEFVLEVILEGYLYLMMLIVPEKTTNQKFKKKVRLVAIFSIVLTIVLALAGITIDGAFNNRVGIKLLIAAGIISLVQIVLGIIGRIVTKKDT